MRTVLSVAEKPSVAKELAAIISRQRVEGIRRAGLSPYNHVYDIPNCLFQNSPARMIITSVTGHLMEIDFDPAFKGWSSCNPVELFTAPVHKEVKRENDGIKKTLMREARQSNILLLWLDCDLEGENIAYEVIKVCLEANPRMEVFRARFSALVERDVFRTLKFPDRPNSQMNDAVDARQEIDLRIGAAFTRFQTLRLQRKFEGVGNSVISFGPCQFPTLGFVVERSAKIKAFQPESFWSITCSHEFENPDKPGSKLICNFNWDRTRVYDQYACTILYESCVEGGGSAVVTHCNERPTSKQRPVPLNTIEFQMRASRLLRMTSEHAMGVAEALYQRGILSYPRTETNFFQAGIDLQGLVGDHRNHPDWGAYASLLLDNLAAAGPGGQAPQSGNRFLWPRAGGKDDQAHPPIHPTKCVSLQDLVSEDERRVYDLVSRHFLACCSCDARGSLSTVAIGVPTADGERFHASGLMVLERNWLDVYSQYEQWHANKVPVLRSGDVISLRTLLMSEGRTCPPSPISEAELIATMDRNGIGTDATIAAHITTIQTREYALRNAQNLFEPTKLGLALVEGYNSMGYQLNKPQLRALIEADCQRIAKGEARKEDVVRKCLEDMRQCFLVCCREAARLDASMEKYFTVLGAGAAIGDSEEGHRTVTEGLSVCGLCRGSMDLRQAAAAAGGGGGAAEGRRYLHCATCVKSYILPRGELTAHSQRCVICGFQALAVKAAGTGKEHTICPKCFNEPPDPPIGVEGASEFRCFSCANEDCALAQRLPGSEVDVSPCFEARCSGFLRMKKNSKGFLLSCTITSCKGAWWVPKMVKSANALPGEVCQRCAQQHHSTVHKLRLRFYLDKAPSGTPPESTVCPSCDPIWRAIAHAPLTVPAGRSGRAQSNPAVPLSSSSGNGLGASTAGTTSAGAPGGGGRQESDYGAALAGKRIRKAPQVQAQINFATGGLERPAQAGSAGPAAGADHSAPGLEVGAPQTMCGCGAPCKLLIVSKEGPNKGRPFFSCSKARGQGCDFFEWADEAPRQQPTPRAAPRRPAPGPATAPSAGATTGVGPKNCLCGESASVVVTKKPGPNMGRQFYSCRKGRDDATRCNFFEWVS